MDVIYNDACDKNVATRIVYADDSNKLFYDEQHTKEVAAEDAMNLFVKGVVAVKSGVYYKAISCTEVGVINFGFTA